MIGFALVLCRNGAFAQAKPPLAFAIVAQPLASALETYSHVSGIELFYDGELVIDRRSAPVDGLLAPDVALRTLLSGTGLVAKMSGPNSITIGRASRSRAADTADRSYFAAIQRRISQVLCERPETRPATSDTLIQLWIAASGTIQRASLIDDVNHPTPGNAFAIALKGLSVGAPPAGMPQPITMAVLARTGSEPTGCARSATAGP